MADSSNSGHGLAFRSVRVMCQPVSTVLGLQLLIAQRAGQADSHSHDPLKCDSTTISTADSKIHVGHNLVTLLYVHVLVNSSLLASPEIALLWTRTTHLPWTHST